MDFMGFVGLRSSCCLSQGFQGLLNPMFRFFGSLGVFAFTCAAMLLVTRSSLISIGSRKVSRFMEFRSALNVFLLSQATALERKRLRVSSFVES